MNLPKIMLQAKNKSRSSSKARKPGPEGSPSTTGQGAPVAFDAAVLYLLCRLGSWPGLSAEDLRRLARRC